MLFSFNSTDISSLVSTFPEYGCPVGRKKLGLGAEKGKNLPVLSLLFVRVFKQLGLSGENRAWVLHYKTATHVKCGFRCKLCNFLRVAVLLGEDLLHLTWASSSRRRPGRYATHGKQTSSVALL